MTVEAVDLRDLVGFAEALNLASPQETGQILDFAQKVMTNVGAGELTRRLDTLRRGQARKMANDVEAAVLAFETNRCHQRAAGLLVELNKQSGARVFRPAVFRACMQALQRCERVLSKQRGKPCLAGCPSCELVRLVPGLAGVLPQRQGRTRRNA